MSNNSTDDDSQSSENNEDIQDGNQQFCDDKSDDEQSGDDNQQQEKDNEDEMKDADQLAQESSSAREHTVSTADIPRDKQIESWDELDLHQVIKFNLTRLNFHYPLNIQKYSLKQSVTYDTDIILSAQTGSGKTLAFAIPILNKLLKTAHNNQLTRQNSQAEYRACLKTPSHISALIIAPSRELVEQIHTHLTQLTEVEVVMNKERVETKPTLKVCKIVGGLQEDKDQRMLASPPDILVATPGRLLKLLQNNIEFGKCPTLNLLPRVEFLVLDEVDKLGQSCQLTDTVKILNEVYLRQERKSQKQNFLKRIDEEEGDIVDLNKILTDEMENQGMMNFKDVNTKDLEVFNEVKINKQLDQKDDNACFQEITSKGNFLHRRLRTQLASATLMLDTRPTPNTKNKGKKNDLKRKRKNDKAKKGKKGGNTETFAHKMIKFIRFQKDHPAQVVDLMKEEKSPKNLTTQQIIYQSKAKKEGSAKFEKLSSFICYLKMINLTNKSVLIFINDIRFTKTIKEAMELFGFERVKLLHSKMKQGERFKRLEFINSPIKLKECSESQNYRVNNKYLVCTDVCARGMDIQNVGLVVHFERPLNPDSQVHRAGRAARGLNSGLNLVLVGSKETKFLNDITLFHGEDKLSQVEVAKTDQEQALAISKKVLELIEIEKRLWRIRNPNGKEEEEAEENGLVQEKVEQKDTSGEVSKRSNLQRIIKESILSFNNESIVMKGKQMFGKKMDHNTKNFLDQKNIENLVTLNKPKNKMKQKHEKLIKRKKYQRI